MDIKKLKIIKNEDHIPSPLIGKCLDCLWEDLLINADTDYIWDEFKSNEIAYPICPDCGGGVEVG